jgi:hypothetical protein
MIKAINRLNLTKYMLYFFALSTVPNLCSQTVSQPFTDVISAPATTIRSGSAVRLDITITNSSNQLISLIDNRVGPREAGISIWDSNGNQLSPRDEYRSYVLHSKFAMLISPGKSIVESVNLNKWFDLTKPGQYKMRARRKIPGSDSFVESNELAIAITP